MHRGLAPSTPSSAALDAGSALVLLAGLLGCLLCVLGLVGCGRDVRVELFEITSVGPDRIEAGRRVEIEGRGLPVGADASLVLTGTLHQPGFAEHVEISLPVEIESAEHAEGLVTGAFLEQLGGGGRGTFRGDATLLVPMADEANGSVSGTLTNLVLDLRPNRLEADEDALDSRDLSAWWGLELAEDPELGLLRVVHIEADSRGAGLGVTEGDMLIGVDGMRVFDARDLSGWSETPVRLEIDRGHGPVELGATTPAAVAPDTSLRGLQLGALLIVVALALRERDRPTRGRSRSTVSLQGVALVALALGPLQLAVHALGADRLPMLLAPVFALVVIATSVTGHAMRSPWVVASGLLRALALLGVVLLAAVNRGTMDLAELERAQALVPTQWTLLATPAAPAFMVLLALSLPPAAPHSAALGARILNRASEIAVSALVVLCLAGGRGEANALGVVLFVARGLLVFGGLYWTRAALNRWPLRARGAVVLGALTLVLAMAALAPDPERAMVVGRAASELWLAALVVGALLQLRPRPENALHAELAL